MTKQEILTRKLETLENQEKNIVNMLNRTQSEIKSVNEELTFEVNRKKNNIVNRITHYENMLKNISKDRADTEAELNQIASDGKQKETNRTSKFG